MQKGLRDGGAFFCGLLFKDPFFIEHETHDHVDHVGDNVREVAGLHEARHEIADAHAPGNVFEQVDAAFEDEQVYRVRTQEHDGEPDDFGALLVLAFEVPDAVAEVAVQSPRDKAEKVGKFQIPVKNLVENPDHDERDEGV
jgi:hypothetical protein